MLLRRRDGKENTVEAVFVYFEIFLPFIFFFKTPKPSAAVKTDICCGLVSVSAPHTALLECLSVR